MLYLFHFREAKRDNSYYTRTEGDTAFDNTLPTNRCLTFFFLRKQIFLQNHFCVIIIFLDLERYEASIVLLRLLKIQLFWYVMQCQVIISYKVWLLGISEFSLLDPINTLNAELNPICHLLTLLGAHHIFHISSIRVNIMALLIEWRRKI